MGGDPLRRNTIENEGKYLFGFDISFLDRRHVNGLVSADSKEQAEERLRTHPDLKDVVGLQIHSLENQGDLAEIEKNIASKVSELEDNLPNNNNERKLLN